MKLLSIRLGTNDLAKARQFYDATLAALDVDPSNVPDTHPIIRYDLGGVALLLGAARNAEAATHANGGTVLFEADDEAAVREWHAAGLAHGGSCEGPPEPKPQARGAVGAYLRDPDGNKLGCYHGLRMG